jgi:hypothetical protein
MEGDLSAGMLRLDLAGRARMSIKVGALPTRDFWTRLDCPMYFTVQDGNARPVDSSICRSWWSP